MQIALQLATRVANHFTESPRHNQKICFVRGVSFWHGGDCLSELNTYVLDASGSLYSHEEIVPGVWHEACLCNQDLKEWHIPLPMANKVYEVVSERRYDQPVVVVRTFEGIECLVIRHFQNESEAASMSQVAELRDILSFEWRYNFQGIAHDALRQQAQERQK